LACATTTGAGVVATGAGAGAGAGAIATEVGALVAATGGATSAGVSVFEHAARPRAAEATSASWKWRSRVVVLLMGVLLFFGFARAGRRARDLRGQAIHMPGCAAVATF
jgi:hypothetical protein